MSELKDRLKDVEAKFDKLQEEIKGLQQKVNEGNKQISARKEEQVRLQGEYRLLQDMLKEGAPEQKSPEKQTSKKAPNV